MPDSPMKPDRPSSEHLVHPLLQTARGYLTDEDYTAVEATLQEAVERAKDLELLVFWCPDAEVCKTCPCADEDDVCFPGEKLRQETGRLRAENEALRDVDAAAERIFASGILDEIYAHAYEFGQRGRPVGSDRDCMQDAVSIARLALASTTKDGTP